MTFGRNLCVMAPCVLEAHIPCLVSRTWVQDVGAIIDLANQRVRFELFDVTLPLVMVSGHLGLDVSSYKEQEACFVFWHQHHSEIV